jgi:5-(carboxyamino)imidazole ribonucleotide synthase
MSVSHAGTHVTTAPLARPAERAPNPVPPGATIGILGGGQLGRMMGMAARTMGYDVHVLDPDPDCPARAIASRTVTARFTDADAAASLAAACATVTLEIESIAVPALDAVRRHAPLRPGAHVLHVTQDRQREKDWLVGQGFPVGPYRVVSSADEAARAVRELGDVIIKTCQGGYDGRGQVRVSSAAEATDAWMSLGGVPTIVEQRLDLAREISVLVARAPSGEVRAFPPAWNHHERGILAWSVIPAPIPAAMARRAEEIACGIATGLDVEGLVAVEMFVLADDTVLVNELAPRPHNSYHATERGSLTSQFEQAVRAACDLPLGDTASVVPAAIANLLGDLWDGGAPDFAAALTVPGVRLHLYGKTSARPGRKMGHLSAVGDTPEAARAAVLEAHAKLT